MHWGFTWLRNTSRCKLHLGWTWKKVITCWVAMKKKRWNKSQRPKGQKVGVGQVMTKLSRLNWACEICSPIENLGKKQPATRRLLASTNFEQANEGYLFWRPEPSVGTRRLPLPPFYVPRFLRNGFCPSWTSDTLLSQPGKDQTKYPHRSANQKKKTIHPRGLELLGSRLSEPLAGKRLTSARKPFKALKTEGSSPQNTRHNAKSRSWEATNYLKGHDRPPSPS